MFRTRIETLDLKGILVINEELAEQLRAEGIMVCRICHQDEGEFNLETGNHPTCEELRDLRAQLATAEAELGRELIEWAAYSYLDQFDQCAFCHRTIYFNESKFDDHKPDCLHVRAKAALVARRGTVAEAGEE